MFKPKKPNAPPSGARPRPTLERPKPEAPPLRAAQGDDDLMSKPPPSGDDEANDRWKHQVGAARIAWGKLTDDEILQSDGRIQKLAGLVKERYAITLTEAEDQVMRFLDIQAALPGVSRSPPSKPAPQ